MYFWHTNIFWVYAQKSWSSCVNLLSARDCRMCHYCPVLCHYCPVLVFLPTPCARAHPFLYSLANVSHFCYCDNAIATKVTWYLPTDVIYIPWTANGIEYFFHISAGRFDIFFGGISMQVLCRLLNCSICFLAIELVPYMFWTLASVQICLQRLSLSLWGLLSCSVDCFPRCRKHFSLMQSHLSISCFCCLYFCGHIKKHCLGIDVL